MHLTVYCGVAGSPDPSPLPSLQAPPLRRRRWSLPGHPAGQPVCCSSHQPPRPSGTGPERRRRWRRRHAGRRGLAAACQWRQLHCVSPPHLRLAQPLLFIRYSSVSCTQQHSNANRKQCMHYDLDSILAAAARRWWRLPPWLLLRSASARQGGVRAATPAAATAGAASLLVGLLVQAGEECAKGVPALAAPASRCKPGGQAPRGTAGGVLLVCRAPC